MEQQSSFSRLVFNKALANTLGLFGSKLWDAGYLLLSLVIGASIYWLVWGLPGAMNEVISIAVFSFAPLGIFVASIFLWHLLLAPAELVYDAKQVNLDTPGMSLPEAIVQPVNWDIWKQRSKYSVNEFAGIFANCDPLDHRSNLARASFKRLLLEAIADKGLAYIPTYWVSDFSGTRTENEVDGVQPKSKRTLPLHGPITRGFLSATLCSFISFHPRSAGTGRGFRRGALGS